MSLVKSVLHKDLYNGLYRVFTNQAANAANGDEQESPDNIIKKVSDEMATVISDAVEKYVKSGDVWVNGSHISVVSPHGACSVTPTSPAKIS